MKRVLVSILLSYCILNLIGCSCSETKEKIEKGTDTFIEEVEENDISGKYINGILGGGK